jgi:hypothetical protein
VDALSVHNVPLNEFGDLVSECKSLLFSNSDYVVSFVRRQMNRVADRSLASAPNTIEVVKISIPRGLFLTSIIQFRYIIRMCKVYF